MFSSFSLNPSLSFRIYTHTCTHTQRDDDWITSYRCHGVAYVRGCTVEEIMAEQFGYSNGVVKGKGGSMHLYKKDSNFWGGAAIVGAQVPVGAGLAFCNKYQSEEGEKMNVSMSFYGDGRFFNNNVLNNNNTHLKRIQVPQIKDRHGKLRTWQHFGDFPLCS